MKLIAILSIIFGIFHLVSTSSIGRIEGKIEDEEVQLADENQIDSSLVIPTSTSTVKMFYTTSTYYATLFRNGTSFVTSNLETVTNRADATVSPTLVQPSKPFYTTITEYKKLQILPTSVGIRIDATEEPSVGLLESTVGGGSDIAEDTFIIPELESGEFETTLAPSSVSVTPSLSSSDFVSS